MSDQTLVFQQAVVVQAKAKFLNRQISIVLWFPTNYYLDDSSNEAQMRNSIRSNNTLIVHLCFMTTTASLTASVCGFVYVCKHLWITTGENTELYMNSTHAQGSRVGVGMSGITSYAFLIL